MYAEERRLHILDLLKKKKRVDVSDLAERLEISPETIRRDLNEMEADGFLKRTHGGAIYLDGQKTRPLLSLQSRRDVNYDKKAGIARMAAEFVEDGDVIAIDNSTTAGCMLEFIPAALRLTIVTYSLQVIAEIISKPDHQWTCISLGGIVHEKNMSTHGMLTANALGFFQPAKLFASCAGVSPEGLLTEGTLIDAGTKREILQCSRQTYLLVDESKWGQVGAVNWGNAADLDFLITNAGVDPAKLAFLAGGKVRILFDG